MTDALSGAAAGRAAGNASRSAGDKDTSIWRKAKPASFEIDGRPKVLFPVWERSEGSHSVRIVARKVPFVDGAQLDETGCEPKEWSTSSPFFNEVLEGEPALGTSVPLYPDRLEKLEAIFELRKTGTLHLPWRRHIRCKAVKWVRTATTDQFDGETLSVQWVQDNENKLDNPSAGAGLRASLSFTVRQAVFEAEREGMWDGSWEQLTTLAAQLEATLAAPGEFRDDILHKANRVARCCSAILTSFATRVPGRDGLLRPSGQKVHSLVQKIREIAERAEPESREARPRTRTRRTEYAGSIWDIATSWNESPYELLDLNVVLPDPNWIPKGYPLLVPVF